MIDTLSRLTALSERWLAPLKGADPTLYAELADTIVVTPAAGPVATRLPVGGDAALAPLCVGTRGRCAQATACYGHKRRLTDDGPA